MSADNWATCPRCSAVAIAELAAREAAVDAAYGVASLAEFDAARQKLADANAAAALPEATLREDYAIYGAETGTVTVEYRGGCTKCGLRLSFTEEHPIPDWNGQ